ncbi:MAG: anhydro-N-acetylmuramic acid kinase [Nitrospirae bacterium]|nr:MAG: anhydro-N-acetylmuramic acid kinase [Nitrospirota bacterium]
MKVIGLMSGTSADGVDAVLVDIGGTGHNLKVRLLAHRTFPYPAEFRVRLLGAMTNGTVADACHLNVVLGEWFAKAALKLLKAARVPAGRVALIGSHGQTLHHLPGPRREPGLGSVRSTLQLGEPAVIAERTGITTVAGFRTRDMAVGGEGAPLTPYLHYLLFHQASRSRVVVNIGGISNLTYLPARGGLGAVRAFDTGPGNMLIDGVMRHVTADRRTFDRGGRLARAGTPSESLLGTLLEHPFLRRRPPKSTGREEFGERFVGYFLRQGKLLGLSDADLAATATAYTARTIAGARTFLPGRVDEVLVCGGGAQNAALMGMLQTAWKSATVQPVETTGWDGRALEAVAFAVFAYQHVKGVPCNLPNVTGAKRAVVLGMMTPGATS